MSLFSRYAFCLSLLAFILAGCDSAGEDESTPPALILAEAFSLQTDLFRQEGAPKTAAGPHFTAAALRVWPVSLILGANLVVPVAVTGAALQADPERDGTTWTWASTTRANGHDVTFTLAGTVEGSTVRWSARVSLSDGQQTLDDFELYTARTDGASQTGSWQLFYRIDGERRNVLNADFSVSGDAETAITYSVPASAERHAGDMVRYEVEGATRVFSWTQVAEGMEHHVAWDAATREGSITASNYNDGQQACWDTELENTACAN